MRFSFIRPCAVGVVTPDGDRTTWHYGVGECVDFTSPSVVTLATRTHMDFLLPDGSVLIAVPLNAIHWEPAPVSCV